MRKVFGVFALLFLVSSPWSLVPGPLFAASFHPYYGWRTIESPHFSIHYHHHIEEVAQRAAKYLEEAHEKLVPKYEWRPWGKTQVVLTDNNDESNGMASTLPYNTLLLRIVPPDPESSLNTYDDWLKTLITHEYTHILHLDAYRGFWRPFHFLFGKIVSPAGLTPGWIKEGAATLEETVGTKGGRGRASYSEMLVRTAFLTDKFPPIDRAAGVHWKWPSRQTQYLFGVKFLQFLSERYGEDKLQEFHRRTQRSFFIGAINHQAKKVFGKSFYKLWKEWQSSLKEKYTTWEYYEEKKSKFTEVEPYLTGKDSFYLPTFSKDGKKLAYVSLNPKRAPQLMVRNLETGKEQRVSKKVPTQMTFSPDGKTLVFSALGVHQRYYFYYDLFQIDLEAKKPKEKRLTNGERAKDPDWSPTGKKIMFVSGGAGADQLKLYDVETKKITGLVSRVTPQTQFANLRYSPDGSQVAFVQFLEKEGWRLCLADSNGRVIKRISQEGLSVASRPAWSPDGRSIIYSSDEDGVSNLFAYDLKTGAKRRLTHIKTGLFEPAVSPDGTLLARHYNGEGFDVQKIGPETRDQRPGTKKQEKTRSEQESQKDSEGSKSLVPSPGSVVQKYSPFRQSLFLPRFIAPGFFVLDNGLLVSLATGASDPLHYHNWQGGVTYRTDAKHTGYFGQYFYNRFRPVFGMGVDDSAVDFGNITFTRTGNTYHFFEERRRGQAFLTYPLGKGHTVSASYFYEDRLSVTNILTAEANDLNLGIFAGLNFNYFYGKGENYPASISYIEKGRLLRSGVTLTDHRLGSNEKNEQRIITADWREFIPLGKNHVAAFRLAGGAAFGDKIFPGTFSLGGSLGEGVLASQYSSRYYSLRGLPVGTLIRDRVLISSLEYRLPLVSPQRGLGTWPIFLNNLHLAFFSDMGDAWNDRDVRTKNGLKDFFDDFLVSTGLETRADFVLGHGLPVTGRLGYGVVVVNRGRLGNLTDPFLKNRVKNGIFILQFGTSF